MQVRLLPVLLVCASFGCSRKLEGPTPSLSSTAPAAACPAQLDTTVELSGEGLSPLVTGSLTQNPLLNLPHLTLVQAQDLAGAAGSGSVELPDDPADPGSSAVKWTSAEQMSFRVWPDLALPDGLYDVQISNPGGASATLPGGLLSVPPPSLASLSQDIACGAKDNALTLAGDFFIRSASAGPTLAFGAQVLQPGTAGGCRALPGGAGLEACTSLPVTLDAGTLAPGRYAVSVKNPDPVGCASAVGPALTVFDRPKITQVAPLGICSEGPTTTLAITGTGFLSVAGADPKVRIGGDIFSASADACTVVDGTLEVVRQCTRLTVTVPTDTFTPGLYPVTVTNPAPVDCASSDVFELEVSPPPRITSVAPTSVCSGGASLTLTGTGFADAATVTLSGVDALSVTVAPGGLTAVARFPSGLPEGGPYAVTFANSDGCSDTSAATITVIPGPQIFFVDPNVVYTGSTALNGIAVQATIYGTGFTGAVQGVSMTPNAGGAATALAFTYDALRPNQVQVVIPKNTPPGDYDIELSDTTDCVAPLVKGLKVVNTTTLTLGTPPMVPAFGWVSESTAVTVSAVAAAGGGFKAVPRLYLNPTTPGPTTVATAVGAVTFLDATRLTALVPTPKLPVGSYDLIAVNPDGTVGFAASAFRVTALPPPSVDSISPGSVSNANPESFDILGKDFRAPAVTLSCVDATGAPLASAPTAAVSAPTATRVTVTFDASAAGVACVVRLTDGDNATFADYSALVITNPAQNLYGADAGPDLGTPRRASVALGGNATSAARYLHVIGGDNGAGPAFDSVESSSLSLLGAPSAFVPQRSHLNQARAFAGGASLGRFLYVAGGSSGTARLDTVERAAVLDPAGRGEVTDLLLEITKSQGLGGGIWYYRVASVMKDTDPFNPLGENLASDPFPVQLPDLGGPKFKVTVSWKADPGAASYRVYRSPTAGATVGTEQVIAEVPGGTTSYPDLGDPPISTDRPLPVGSLGKWQTLTPRLSVPREGAGVAIAAAGTKAYLYVLGGRQNAATALASYELLEFTLGANGSQTPAAAFTPGTASLSAARWQLGASVATGGLTARIPAGTSYVYAASGVAANGTSTVSNFEAGLVGAAGQLTFTPVGPTSNQAGYVTLVAGNFVFAFGGANAGPDNKINSGEICAAGVTGCGSAVTPELRNFQPGQTMLSGRYLHAGALSGAYIYVVGGVTVAGAPPTVTASTEYRLW